MEDELHDQAGVAALGRAVARLVRPGDAVLLSGPLGAGKTTLARALIRAACGDAALEVPSPSYTLVQSYDRCRPVLHHFDLWRLDGSDALQELGWDEAREDVVVVEWPDRLGALRPPGALEILLEPRGELRSVALAGWSDRRAMLRAAWQEAVLF